MKIYSFGIAKEITQTPEIDFPIEEEQLTVKELRARLIHMYPALGKLTTLAIAVNEEFADGKTIVTDGDEVALIPPVSGG